MSVNPSNDGEVTKLAGLLEKCLIGDTLSSGARIFESCDAVAVTCGTVEEAGLCLVTGDIGEEDVESSVDLPTTSDKGKSDEDTAELSYIRYAPGDIIQDQLKPLTKTLKTAYRGKLCSNCFSVKNNNLLHCKACGLMSYCNKECQTVDWYNGHKLECKSSTFKTYSGNGIQADIVFQLLRLWATLKNPKNRTRAYTLYDGSTRTYEDLPSNAGKHVVIPECIEEWRKVVAELSKEDPSVTLDLFINYFKILMTNGFSIKNFDETEEIGIGIYIEASVFQHSCKPTALYYINGIEMQVRAIAPIAEGEIPTVCFIPKVSCREERQKRIWAIYNFECHCSLCENQLDTEFDYDLLGSMQTICGNAMNTNLSWPEVLHSHMTATGMLETIFHKFDDRITDQFKVVSEFGIWKMRNCGEMPYFPCYMTEMVAEMKTQLSLIIVEAEHRLFKTYGPDHFLYKEFKCNLPEGMRDIVYR